MKRSGTYHCNLGDVSAEPSKHLAAEAAETDGILQIVPRRH